MRASLRVLAMCCEACRSRALKMMSRLRRGDKSTCSHISYQYKMRMVATAVRKVFINACQSTRCLSAERLYLRCGVRERQQRVSQSESQSGVWLKVLRVETRQGQWVQRGDNPPRLRSSSEQRHARAVCGTCAASGASCCHVGAHIEVGGRGRDEVEMGLLLRVRTLTPRARILVAQSCYYSGRGRK